MCQYISCWKIYQQYQGFFNTWKNTAYYRSKYFNYYNASKDFHLLKQIDSYSRLLKKNNLILGQNLKSLLDMLGLGNLRQNTYKRNYP